MIVVATKRKPDMEEEEEEGWERWTVVVAAFFTQFIVCGITYSLGVFHVVFKDIFYESHFDTSWIGSILLYITALSSVMLRFVTSYWGSRVSIMAGGFLSATGLALCAAVQDLYQLYMAFGLLVGVGFGLACSPSIVAVERSFIRGRFRATSLAVAGIGAGIITFPIIIRYLLEFFAWRGAFLILSGVALNLCVCGALMRPKATDKELHLLPLLSCLPMRVPLFHGMCVANLFWSFGSTVIYMYLPAYAISQGTSFETSTLLVSCIGISSLCARMIFAFMGQNSALDEVTSVLCSIGLGVVLTGICPLLFDHYPGQIGYTLLFGFYSGFWTTFLSQVSRELIGPEYIALGNGYLSFMIALGALTAGPAAGLLIQEENEYKHAFYLAGSCLLWSSIIMIMFKLKRCAPSREEFDIRKEQKDIQKVPLIVDEVEPSRDPLPTLAEEIVVDTAIITSV